MNLIARRTLFCWTLLLPALSAQQGARNGEWRFYGGDAGTTKYSALDQIDAARRVCGQCPVTHECLEFALGTNQESGVWGGLSEDERRALKRRARVGASA